MELDKPVAGVLGLPESNQSSALDKIKEVARAYDDQIAYYGGEMHLREDTGAWAPAEGSMKRYFLEVFGSDPVRSGTWGAAMIYFAVDPDNLGESVYFKKERGAAGGWKPMKVEPHQVVFAKGIYDLRTRKLEPFGDSTIPFGPLVENMPSEEVLTAARAGDFSTAPQRSGELFKMIQYALMHNEQRDPETEKFFQATVAQVLRPHCGLVQFVNIIGESGARKTTIMRALLSAPIGPRGLSEVPEAHLASRIFMRPKLVNKIANLSNDSAQSADFVPFIKEVTSGILVYDKKFRDAGQVKMTAKLFSTMNRPQILDDPSLGIENRVIVFKFNPRADNNRGAMGTAWMDALHYTAEDRAWIVAWMLVALESQWDTGEEVLASPTPRIREWKDTVLNEACPIRRFINEALEFGAEFSMPKNQLYDLAVEDGIMKPEDHRMKIKLGEYLVQRHNVRPVRVQGKDALGKRTTSSLYNGCRPKTVMS